MKKHKLLLWLAISLLAIPMACDEKESPIGIGLQDPATNIFDYNVFNTLNHRGLGDTANDMKRYGNKIYIVVDISSVIEVIDAHTLLSVAQISLHNASGTARQPRHIVFHNSSAYVSCFDGSVVEIDTTSLQVYSACD